MSALRHRPGIPTADKESFQKMTRSTATLTTLAIAALALIALAPAAAQASFGIVPESFTAGSFTESGEADTRAAGHPFEASTSFAINTDSAGIPEGFIKDVVAELPPGFVGNPNATPRCSPAVTQGCPNNTAVGIGRVRLVIQPKGLAIPAEGSAPIYNMVPERGALATFKFTVVNTTVWLDISLRTGGDYGVTARANNINEGAATVESEVALWGVPADPVHDPFRGSCLNAGGSCPFAGDGPPLPLLTNPAACEGHPLTTTLRVSSWQQPGVFDTATAESPEPTGCDEVPFNPSISVTPDTTEAGAPTGLTFELRLPQSQDPDGLGTSPLKKAVVTLPEGMTMSPPAAVGLEGCTPSQIGLHSEAPDDCPPASRIGTVRVESPNLPEGENGEEGALTGFAYLGRPEGGLNTGPPYPLYFSLSGYGLNVKLAGEVTPDPKTGQITTTFEENPPLPFDRLVLQIKGGPRAPLVNPSECGPHVTTSSLAPWSAPEGPRRPSATFTTSGPCPATPPFSPAVRAGTADPAAGHTSPFRLHLTRPDGNQPLMAIDVKPPPGLTAYLRNVPYCPESAIAAAIGRSGSAETATPACPAASRLGASLTGAGAGPEPYYVAGTAYLAGPYKGAPLSLLIFTPAVAGPFDLGTVVVRSALHVDPATARITVKSDPLPLILGGVPLQVRDVRVEIDRPDFTLNPTSCDPMAVETQAVSAFGAVADLFNRFQVGGCRDLGFAPRLALRLKGGTKRGKHPKLISTVTYPEGPSANIARAQVKLPRSAFLDQGHIGTVCTRVQWAADACPKASVYGRAVARTPLLDYPLRGKVYLRSSDNLLPDLVADLRGPDYQPIRVELVGRTDSVKGALRNTFDVVPDAPVSSFRLELFGGNRGLVVNSQNLCRGKHLANVKLRAHNGKVHNTRPTVRSDCGKKRKVKRAKRSSHGRAQRLAARRSVR